MVFKEAHIGGIFDAENYKPLFKYYYRLYTWDNTFDLKRHINGQPL